MRMEPDETEQVFITAPTGELEHDSPWSEFLHGTRVHLGKRSGGWKFCWNFHESEYYSNKDELLAFVRSGRVVDEYDKEWQPEDFIQMALDWGQPDGRILYEKCIDGLNVSTSTEFS